MIILHTNHGPITIVLEPTKAKKTTENFLAYAKQGFYENTIFHRVIDGFMIQGGGFEAGMVNKTPTLSPIDNEAFEGIKNKAGTIAMARTNDPHSASSQFFINLKDNSFLDHSGKTAQGWGYCAFGQVTSGMDIVEKIGKAATTRRMGHDDVPVEDVIIQKVEVVETA